MKLSPEILSCTPFQYADDVRNNRIVTGKKIKLAIDRFYKMIHDADSKGYILDHKNGLHVIDFFEYFLLHTKGEKAKNKESFILSPYQQFTLYNIFAWKKQNSSGNWVRVIKTVYEKVARKNGKTAVLAGLGLYCQAFDDEEGTEIYVGATKEAQAKVLWEQAYQFVFKCINLRKVGFKNTQREIRFSKNQQSGVFRFLGGDSKTLDGLNPSVSIIDEYHAHKDDGVREVLESAMGARSQPLIYLITTAGFNMASVCKQYEDVCNEILLGVKQDDSTLVMIHDLDEGDDWENPNNWIKANPNIDESVNLDYLLDEYKKAINQPSKIPNFKTKHLNLWVDSKEAWISTDVWNANKVDKIPLEKFTKFGSFRAIDLSTTIDITADIILSEPDEDGYRYIKAFFFCPEDTIDRRSKEDRVPYRAWRDAGYLISTPGNTVDYNYLKENVMATNNQYGVKRIELDQWNASQVANDLTEYGLEVSFFSQQIATISFPTKQFEKLVYEGKIKHDGNPVLERMLSGCVIYQDANENIKVHKGHSHMGRYRVDGIVATIMALGGSLSGEEDNNQSQYNDPDIKVII
ncbi:terminase large subunit [Aquimarina sp. 2201CG14-23]|uniref:terminase large subunit n=1 Tax=Aquimarina mycalae TaxID=3040073 RepID=UPI002477DCA2|nr:terminase TerL endonuclease subunit [Aquimarina sp. 2201CG14-23]MDH7444663.1 terminase large subunit [Aquimarina sp. 2201CG14-23]